MTAEDHEPNLVFIPSVHKTREGKVKTGVLFSIQATTTPGNGSIRFDSSVGPEMEECARVAFSYVLANGMELLEICNLDEPAVELNCRSKDVLLSLKPCGSTSDGKSAMAAIVATIASLYTGKKVRSVE